MARKILCVAEKPSIAKSVAQHLSGGHISIHNVRGNRFVKNYNFSFNFGSSWGSCEVIMTSVLGHLNKLEFHRDYKSWTSCHPDHLFDAPVVDDVVEDKKPIAENIEHQARSARLLFIWTDCDREGESIGDEIRKVAREGNRDIEVKRARFSNTERAHIIRAAQQPINLDYRQVSAVAARRELDLRLGAAFTRFTSLTLQALGPPLAKSGPDDDANKTISYGSCQFPTLGFVVDRYFKVRNFIPEKFWSIKVMHERDDMEVVFSWQRHRLFDRATVVILFEKCLTARLAKVTRLQKKPTSKWRPLPLTTVELQKLGSLYLRMTSKRVMDTAESLYNKGWISYPRTETDQFDKGMDLRKLIEKQAQDHAWGPHARGLLNGAFKQPRAGRNNDEAHPPIHPVNYVVPTSLVDEERRVFEFIVRRFLACCSDDAKGESTTVEILYGNETFFTNGLIVLERNYLEVYPYEKWTSSQPLPCFRLHETFEPTKADITEGQTTAPGYLTEPELISLMDANGIGTDATIAEHIDKIQRREYVMIQSSRRSSSQMNGTGTRGGRGGRGGSGGVRGVSNASNSDSNGGTIPRFIPSTLGVALIEGYDSIGLETSLGKPFLRKEMESGMREICAGTKSRNDCVQETLDQYRAVYVRANQQQDVLTRVSFPGP
ncbi:MAG: hypothetical protein Q9217_003820 [Psora testacea]